jgi:hypothetical protein
MANIIIRARSAFAAAVIIAGVAAGVIADPSTGTAATLPACPAAVTVRPDEATGCDLDGSQTLNLIHIDRATCDDVGGRFVIVPNRATVCVAIDY